MGPGRAISPRRTRRRRRSDHPLLAAPSAPHAPFFTRASRLLNVVGRLLVSFVASTVALLHVLEHRRHERQQDLLHVVLGTGSVVRRFTRGLELSSGLRVGAA